MRYLKGTLDYVLRYVTDHEFSLYGYSYSNWSDSIPNQKSTSTYWFSLGSSMVSWSDKKNFCVALNMNEVEYVAACGASHEAMWLRKLLSIGLNLTCR
jgi:hypothetical protein